MSIRRVPSQKLTPPPAWPGGLARPRLEAALDEAVAAGQHVGLFAGMGYGKSTLAAAWAERRSCVWVTLDADDAELDAFLTVLVVAFERALPGFQTEARELLGRARGREAAHAALAALIADLDEQAPAPLVLVIDDYDLAASASMDALAARLLKYLPANIRLVLLARKSPEIEAATLQAARRLRVFGEGELAFSLDELAALRPGARPQELMEASGGWPAAMGLAPELLDAYLEEQLLARAPAEVKALLPKLAVVEAFDQELCEEALGEPLAPPILATLLEERLVVRRGLERYMLHPALRAMLFRRYQAAEPRAVRQALFRRVGEFYWRHGQPLIGLRYWSNHGDAEVAAAHLAEVAEGWLADGRMEALASALEALGAAACGPALLAVQGDLYRRRGDFARADELYEQAVAAGPGPWVARARLGQAQAAAARGTVALARQRREEAGPDLPARLELDAINLEGGLALLSGATEEAIARFRAAAGLAERLGDRFAQARATHNLGICLIRQGAFDQALASYDAAIAATSEDGTPAIWMSPINRALVLIHLGRPAEAEEAAEAALALVRRYKVAREEAYALRVLGFARVRRGAYDAAEACFDAAERLARAAGDELGLAYTLNFRAELAHARGDLVGALARIAEVERALGDPAAAAGILELAQVKAKVLLAAGRPEAQAFAADVVARAEAMGHRHIGESTARLAAGEAPLPPEAAVSIGVELRVRCLGGFRAWRVDGPVNDRDWQTVRAKLLLAYFLHFPDGATKTQLLEDVFFGEEVSNDLMNITILRLRKALEPRLEKGQPSRFVLREDGRYAFNAQARVQLDTHDFVAALRVAQHAPPDQARSRYELALELYHGEFLPGHTSPWVLTLRQRYQDKALEACRALVALLDAQDPRASVRVLQRALEIDPLSEEFNRALILRYLEAREPQRALQQYQLCERRYKELLDLEPPADLARLLASSGGL